MRSQVIICQEIVPLILNPLTTPCPTVVWKFTKLFSLPRRDGSDTSAIYTADVRA